jgi:hypothetical protein
MSGPELVATGWSLHLPGVPLAAAVLAATGRVPGAWASEEHAAPERAATVLGRKGLLAKDAATRLALCAVHRALRLTPGQRPAPVLAARTAVVACSNLGNVETVARVSRSVAAEGSRGVSVLDAPNVSSNVIASAVALWFRLGGPNLMVCSGATAGLDGLGVAALLLRTRRADRVVLVGAEPDDDIAATVRPGIRAGAACVVLEPAADRTAGPRVTVGAEGAGPTVHLGDFYGAGGVVALALAAHLVADEGFAEAGVLDAGEGARRTAVVRAAGARR